MVLDCMNEKFHVFHRSITNEYEKNYSNIRQYHNYIPGNIFSDLDNHRWRSRDRYTIPEIEFFISNQ